MDTLESKSSNDATFLNCFWRSVVFKTMSLLNGSDSPGLFLKTYGIYYLVMLVTSALASLALGSFSFSRLWSEIFTTVLRAISSTLSVFFVCFILNLFLVDDFMRIVNVFTFSGVHEWFLIFFSRIYFKYKQYDMKEIFGNIELIKSIAEEYLENDGRYLTAEQKEFTSALKEVFMSSLVIFTVWMFTFIAFIILLIRNIRALRKK